MATMVEGNNITLDVLQQRRRLASSLKWLSHERTGSIYFYRNYDVNGPTGHRKRVQKTIVFAARPVQLLPTLLRPHWISLVFTPVGPSSWASEANTFRVRNDLAEISLGVLICWCGVIKQFRHPDDLPRHRTCYASRAYLRVHGRSQ